jgi:hypothetical protein
MHAALVAREGNELIGIYLWFYGLAGPVVR